MVMYKIYRRGGVHKSSTRTDPGFSISCFILNDQRNKNFATNFDFLIPTSLEPIVEDLRYFYL